MTATYEVPVNTVIAFTVLGILVGTVAGCSIGWLSHEIEGLATMSRTQCMTTGAALFGTCGGIVGLIIYITNRDDI